MGGDDVGVPQVSHHPRFLQEQIAKLRAVRQVGKDPLQGDDLARASAVGGLGHVQPAHAPLAQDPPQSIATELLCRRIQQREWEHLFDFCYRCALGK